MHRATDAQLLDEGATQIEEALEHRQVGSNESIKFDAEILSACRTKMNVLKDTRYVPHFQGPSLYLEVNRAIGVENGETRRQLFAQHIATVDTLLKNGKADAELLRKAANFMRQLVIGIESYRIQVRSRLPPRR